MYFILIFFSLIVYQTWNSGTTDTTYSFYFIAGKYYSFNVRWCQTSGTYGFSTKWSYTGVSNVTIPNSNLYLPNLVSSSPFNIEVFSVWTDGYRTGSEVWDDSNKIDGDGCSSTWTIESGWGCYGGGTYSKDSWEVWGDGIRFSSLAWDDGNSVSGDGWSSTWLTETKAGYIWLGGTSTTKDTWEVWGDGLNMGTVSWDDGNRSNGDGWNYYCYVESGWTCSGGTTISKDTCVEIWGDGKRFNSNTTYCDDGNKINNDGCDSTWTTESGYTWSGGNSSTKDTCNDIWGDGKKYSSSSTYWDDGGSVNGDGWSSTWSIETGWSCTGGSPSSPDVWSEIWGDGIRFNLITTYCDDGNKTNNDGCDSTWTTESGYTWSGGNSSTKDTCIEIWGDGKRFNSNTTYCDDGNKTNNDGCNSTWSIETGWSCSGGNLSSPDAWSEVWGDGIRFNLNTTYCDDGNSLNGDGCSSTWSIETGWNCSGGTSTLKDTCNDICGDGKKYTSSVSFWDDGNTKNGDGCSSNWAVETGYICTGGTPSTLDAWTETWGDGIRFNSISSYCDDGNILSNDGCDSGWSIEVGWTWSGGNISSKDICIDICGDGKKYTSAALFWDDGNNLAGDGCSPTWSFETGYACFGGSSTSKDVWSEIWGDGIRFNSNSTYCDDGNIIDGDGCNKNWEIEIGWICTIGTSIIQNKK